MFLVIDNYDSFVHNLARYVEISGAECLIKRNDEITPEEVKALAPEAIILSPGPKTPQDSGICIELIKQLDATTPILGVCLGHQAIGEAYGGTTTHGEKPVHGKATSFTHDGKGLFDNVPSPMTGGRYHSLITTLPDDAPLNVTARTDEGEIMAMHHETHPVYGLQFHPESILTENGQTIINNFRNIALNWNKEAAA